MSLSDDRRVRVLVVASGALVRRGLIRMLAGEPDLAVIADTPSVARAAELVGRYRPHVVLFDAASVPTGRTLALLRWRSPQVALLGLLDREDPEFTQPDHGLAYVDASIPFPALADAVRFAARETAMERQQKAGRGSK